MALLPDRHPQKDFFIRDISDFVPKDDTASMEHPMSSLATKPDMRHMLYKSGENSLEIIPSGLGFPSIKDKDIRVERLSSGYKAPGSRQASARATRRKTAYSVSLMAAGM